MRIDSHQHFWRYAPATHGWIDDRMGVLKRDFLPADLGPLLAGAGPRRLRRGPGLADASTRRASCWTSPTRTTSSAEWWAGWTCARPTVEAQLQELARHPQFKGVRHVAQDEPDDRVPGPRRRAERHLGPRVVRPHLRHPHLPAPASRRRSSWCGASRASASCSTTSPSPRSRPGALSPWRERIRDLAAFAQRLVQGLGPGHRGLLDGLEARRPAALPRRGVRGFRAERLMIGSDWPVCTLAGDYGRVMGVVQDYVDAAARPPSSDAVLGGNRRAVLRARGPEHERAFRRPGGAGHGGGLRHRPGHRARPSAARARRWRWPTGPWRRPRPRRREIVAAGGRALAVAGDVSRDADCRRLVAETDGAAWAPSTCSSTTPASAPRAPSSPRTRRPGTG